MRGSFLRITGIWLVCCALLSSCVGYTPPVIPETDAPPILATTRPTRTARATLAPKTPTPRPSPAPSLGVSEAEVQGETVRFWHVRAAGQDEVLSDLVAEFNGSNAWGIDVELALYEDGAELVQQIQANIYGDLPDLVAVSPFQAAQLSSSGGLLVELSPYVFDRDWGFPAQEIADFYPLFWEQGLRAGQRLGIPFYRLAQVFYYNETWARELGFDLPPATPAEFEEQVCAAAQAGPEDQEIPGEGGWAVDADTATLAAWIYAFGGDILSPDGQGYRFDVPEARQAFTFLKRLLDGGCAWRSEGPPLWPEFAKRRALVITGSTAGLPEQGAALASVSSRDRWTVLPFPSPEGKPAIYAYGPSLSIIKSGPAQQLAAWLFLKWLVTPANQARLAQGSAALPVRSAAMDDLLAYESQQPQWASALALLPYARTEPGYASWRIVRLVLSDAGEELFSPTFPSDQIPELIEILESTADEIHTQTR